MSGMIRRKSGKRVEPRLGPNVGLGRSRTSASQGCVVPSMSGESMSGEWGSIRPDQREAGYGKGQGFVPAIHARAERGARSATPRAGVVRPGFGIRIPFLHSCDLRVPMMSLLVGSCWLLVESCRLPDRKEQKGTTFFALFFLRLHIVRPKDENPYGKAEWKSAALGRSRTSASTEPRLGKSRCRGPIKNT
jgi:hypothetical protein